MRFQLTAHAQRDYALLPTHLQRAVDKQLNFLVRSPQHLRHPSLQAKKYSEADDVWQGRVTRGYRFYFQIIGDTYEILRIVPHPK
jgi:hypothetical protein